MMNINVYKCMHILITLSKDSMVEVEYFTAVSFTSLDIISELASYHSTIF